MFTEYFHLKLAWIGCPRQRVRATLQPGCRLGVGPQAVAEPGDKDLVDDPPKRGRRRIGMELSQDFRVGSTTTTCSHPDEQTPTFIRQVRQRQRLQNLLRLLVAALPIEPQPSLIRFGRACTS